MTATAIFMFAARAHSSCACRLSHVDHRSFDLPVYLRLGLLISGMMQPTRVLSFLDIFGAWDPSLEAFVTGMRKR
jgi:hypothetical protein